MSITKPLRIHRKQMSNRTEDLFNEVYDTGHVPCRLDIPGVTSVYGSPRSSLFSPYRLSVPDVTSVTHPEAQDFEVFPGGECKSVPRGETPGVPRDPRDREARDPEEARRGRGRSLRRMTHSRPQEPEPWRAEGRRHGVRAGTEG